MPTAQDRSQLEKRRSELKARLADVGDMRPGSLIGRYRRCGKPTCHCAQQDATGHGPSWSLTREVAGRTVTRIVPSTAVEQTRRQIEEYRRFRTLMRDLIEVSEQLCDTRLQASRAASEEEAKKGASNKRSTRRSRGKSKRS
jgi:uncharacterized protein DUF6788